jgi:prepilin-type N-terminal cleavage/methylation domain-containing protein
MNVLFLRKETRRSSFRPRAKPRARVPGRLRIGFTLPEVLVTLAIVATLTAVLLPALNNQLSKGDASRVTNDIVAVRTAVGAFTSDVRRYPSALLQLRTAPEAGDFDVLGRTFGGTLIQRWRGPYLSKDLDDSYAMPTGYGGVISPTLGTVTYNGIPYLTVQITGLTPEEFDNIDQIIDETANSSTGQLTISGTTAVWAATPIQ